ncbi:anaerobic benzoate catabolism transcriptional regulator [Clostridium ragsdalei P11]|uniref:Anaerobic benzoate catabolism transcriptional regulator n=1 Tax=Clostridium ragsdalei P11 TaxID=1353534 RepID=A0A1A6ARH4_9CLOT|nr:helix-turn-helix transcriptional regulator [Clostridium ragsdalei]OBR92669.1 anaerobic benzoate catabolism transcriptional regulator [Clostridium ragsdalei P11]
MLSTNEIIGRNILKILNEKDIKQTQLAEKLNISKQTLNKIIHGRRNISINEIKEICDALSVPMEKLTDEDSLNEEQMEPIKLFMGEVNSKEAKCGLMHAQNIMDMILFHSEIQEKKGILQEEWDD